MNSSCVTTAALVSEALPFVLPRYPVIVSIVFTPEAMRTGSPRMVRSALLLAGGTLQARARARARATGAANT